MESVLKMLEELKDAGYAAFSSKLIPNIPPEQIIGVRMPALRQLAKSLSVEEAEAFLSELPHKTLEENTLHALLIMKEKDPSRLVERLDAFLPYVDNWATCDSLRPAAFKKHFAALLPDIRRWLASDETYTVRFGIGALLSFGLDGRFDPEFNALTAGIRSGEYYVNMMRAWYFATALSKQWSETLPYLNGRLDLWTHNMTIRKATESRRITDEQKALLRSLKRSSENEKFPLFVAAGVVFDRGKVLICRRPEGKKRALGWEFPGGKLERGESAERALVRELKEELGFTVRPVAPVATVLYPYPDVTVLLIAIEAAVEQGEPMPLEHSELRFVQINELDSFDLCPADREIAKALKAREAAKER